MIYLSVLVGVLLVLSAEARIGNSSELTFCTETKQCLLFDPICKTDDFEVRHYSSAKWVSTKESNFIMEFATMGMFRRLFGYINGNNANGQKIEMTSPVVMNISETNSFWTINTYTMSFLLPAELQANPPKPTDDDVYIETYPDMKVYVRSYGGWMTTMAERKQARSLASDLSTVNADFENRFHLAVGYNSPMTLFNRHNEVWYLLKDDPVCDSSEEMEFSAMF